MIEEIADWIHAQVAQSRADGVVVGLSGGVDSSVVAGLAKRALGDRVLGTILPCHSQPIDEEYARLAADAFGIRLHRVDLTPIYDALLARLPQSNRVALANVKSRLRMATNYCLANSLNYLVAGTGNKSELYIGYFTKFGDGAADILPIGGLLKCQVRQLARELGVPEPIVARAPTAGLWEGQTDEGEIGLSYDELDRTIVGLEHGDVDGLRPEVVEKVRRMHEISAHKRSLAPVFGPKGQVAPVT